MRYNPGTDAWLSPPDPKVPPTGDAVIYVEREVILDDFTSDLVEVEVVVEFDEGTLWSAKVDGKPFELTPDEIQRAEEDWAMREPNGPDEDDRRDES